MNEDTNEPKVEAHAPGAEADRSKSWGAVIIKPRPPKRGTFALLLPEGIAWDVTRDAGTIRLDFRPMTRAEKVQACRDMQADRRSSGT